MRQLVGWVSAADSVRLLSCRRQSELPRGVAFLTIFTWRSAALLNSKMCSFDFNKSYHSGHIDLKIMEESSTPTSSSASASGMFSIESLLKNSTSQPSSNAALDLQGRS